MALDRSDHEPDAPEEYDPEAEFGDPDSDSLTIPAVDPKSGPEPPEPPEPPNVSIPEMSTAGTGAPADLVKMFWALVLVINAAVFVLSLGIMLFVFEGNTTYSVWLISGGLVLFGLAIRRYRAFDADTSSSSKPTAAETTTTESAPTENETDDTDP
ncbi:DUF7322 domain-containing protein [Natronobacterium gregoryi]|uniref:DUF7322 domain-containing protein n=2 Tax=Natronobacterium gregoryi TaxID=44930 RepID=L0AD92_NATGS|nr:hypothetical protein [Natronobacterium gregoryi]AFZ71816.1 hypothetical protein Natgr_0566 [Natronobacterium gregoryi SP2]SFI87179.1 hypothetical protein SAMN05443661_1085 [Natronobacterium gregoryi]